ncbi:MAG: tetratricopeptide repeat protein [Bacteroidia bacterium]|nr:tetratricopeptide repeat protein [Bacteroidia bacterium]
MTKISLILLPLFLIFSQTSYSLNQIDSLKSIWENEEEIDSVRFEALSEYNLIYSQVMADSVLISLDYHYDLAFKKKVDRELFRALLRKGNIYRNKNQLKQARSHYKQAKIVAKKMGNLRLEAIITGNLGNIYFDQKEHLKSIQFYNEAKNIFAKQDDFDGVARMLLGIGAINSTIGNHDIALEHYRKSLDLYQKNNYDKQSIATIMMNIGLIHWEKMSFYDAQKQFDNALKILQEINAKYYIAACYNMLAKINFELNQLEIAYAFARKNLILTRDLGVQRDIIEAKITYIQIDYSKNKNQSISEMEKILKDLPINSTFNLKRDIYDFLHVGYKYQKKWDLSLQMYELYSAYNDSIQERINSFEIARETIRNEYEAKLFDNKLNAEREKAEKDVNQLKKIFLIITISLLIILIIIYHNFSQNKKNKERREELLNEIKFLKENKVKSMLDSNKFKLSKDKIDDYLKRVLNETDWNVLLILLDNPVAMNKEIADKAFMSIDGIGSSLRRMYDYFEIKETKYKKVSLILTAIKISNK